MHVLSSHPRNHQVPIRTDRYDDSKSYPRLWEAPSCDEQPSDAIIRQALYTGKIDLPTALSAIAAAQHAVPAGEQSHGS